MFYSGQHSMVPEGRIGQVKRGCLLPAIDAAIHDGSWLGSVYCFIVHIFKLNTQKNCNNMILHCMIKPV
jgi:hypothetical protein